MKRNVVALALMLLTVLGCSQGEPALDLERVLASTVTIVVVGPDGQSHGSGFITSSDGMIVTAAHVIDGATSAVVRLQNGEELNVQGVIVIDGVKDFAIVRVAGFDLPTVPLGNADDVSVGQRVIAIGAPLDTSLAGTVSDGLVAAERLVDGTRMLQMSVPVSSGSSGGPVVTEQGEVIGLVVGGMTGVDVQNLNFALPINYVRGLLVLAETMPLEALAEVAEVDEVQVTVGAGNTGSCGVPLVVDPQKNEFGEIRSRAEQGDAEAQLSLGVAYSLGVCVSEDYTEAARWYRLAAEQGHSRAQWLLGAMYASGDGVREDDAEAMRWYRLAAEQGFPQAQYNLGDMYDNGKGVPEDIAEAVRWYRLAAGRGHSRAQWLLGNMYNNGEGVPEDDAEAVRWYRLGAEQGDPTSQFYLAAMYDRGEGVPEDNTEAARWYRLAAEQSHPSAQYNLGVMYDIGEGVPEDDAEAVRWYRFGAERGDADSQNNLGRQYSLGEGVPEDFVLAYMWFNLGAAQGNELAQGNKDSIEQRMTREAIAEGQRLTREWIPTYTFPGGGN
jgi:hypothetical protein